MAIPVELRLVDSAEQAWQPGEGEPLSTANNAVPLLWLSLFSYDDIDIRRVDERDAFAAVVPVAVATTRVDAFKQALPQEAGEVIAAAALLHSELESISDKRIALFPAPLFATLAARAARAYLQQLVHLCDLLEQFRGGLDWATLENELSRISPEIGQIFTRSQDQHTRYYLLGSLAERQRGLEHYLIREGQGPDDVEPQALAVGEQGLLLGRFDGTWKLLSSGSDADLRGVWSSGGTTYMVGRRGTVIRFKQGRASTIEVPTDHTLHAVWGLGPRSLCVAGEHGTVLAFNGEQWTPWPVPTQAALRCIWGIGPENICIGGQEAAVLRFDGYAWNRTPLPIEGVVNAICGEAEGPVWAFGGSAKGGEAFVLQRDGWVRDASLPSTEWLEGAWLGWAESVGTISASGHALVNANGQWSAEAVPLEHVTTAAGGALPIVAGTSGEFSVIAARGEGGWRVEASLRELRLHGLWVAGRPKPPRLKPQQPPAPNRGDPAGGDTPPGDSR